MEINIYCEVDSGRISDVSRTITGDHESRVTDTGGIVIFMKSESAGCKKDILKAER